jgi:hypothetical protein
MILDSESLEETNSSVPIVSYLLNFRRATGGSFTLTVYDPLNTANPYAVKQLFYPLAADKFETARLLESAIQRMVISEAMELDSCGLIGTTKCSNAVKVFPVADDAFGVFFAGERLNVEMELFLETSSLEFEEEMFLNNTNDIIKQHSDVCYSNLATLDIYAGDIATDVVLNVRGKC